MERIVDSRPPELWETAVYPSDSELHLPNTLKLLRAYSALLLSQFPNVRASLVSDPLEDELYVELHVNFVPSVLLLCTDSRILDEQLAVFMVRWGPTDESHDETFYVVSPTDAVAVLEALRSGRPAGKLQELYSLERLRALSN